MANETINGHQMTVVGHVDDLKIPCKNMWEVTKMALWLSKIYGDIKVQHEKQMEYLGIDLDYAMPGKVKISMVPCITEVINNFFDEIIGTR